jgi:hypothetical protein
MSLVRLDLSVDSRVSHSAAQIAHEACRVRTHARSLLGVCLVVTACHADTTPEANDKGSSVVAPATAPTAPDAVPPAAPAPIAPSEAAPPRLRGNAETNPACKLLTIEQVSTSAGLPVSAVLGLVADTANPAKHSESCTWFLASEEIQASLVVQ